MRIFNYSNMLDHANDAVNDAFGATKQMFFGLAAVGLSWNVKTSPAQVNALPPMRPDFFLPISPRQNRLTMLLGKLKVRQSPHSSRKSALHSKGNGYGSHLYGATNEWGREALFQPVLISIEHTKERGPAKLWPALK
jgi:hypothetical protein